MRDVVVGLDFCHQNKICHRDIKPENILVDGDGNGKLADFGSAKFFAGEDDMMRGSVGTYHFFAPELCNENIKEYSGRAADIWALGITLYAMVFNKLPFCSLQDVELLDKIANEEVVLGKRNLSDGLKSLLEGMLTKDVS